MAIVICYDSPIFELLVISVSRQHLHHLNDQAKVKVVQQAQNVDLSGFWFAALAVVFAGVFYFWAYYYGGDWWRVLTGG